MPFDLEAEIRAAEPPPAFAVVFPDDPRYADWVADLGTDAVPIASILPDLAHTPDGGVALFYNADVSRMDAGQRDRVARRVAARFGLPVESVAADIARGILPVRADGLFICPDPEACRETIDAIWAARDPGRN